MGADLTILSTYDGSVGGFEVSQNAVDHGYFRDSYNSGGLFAVLSASTGKTYSYWRFSDEAYKNGWIDGNDNLKPEGAKELLKIAKEAKEAIENIKRLSEEVYLLGGDDSITIIEHTDVGYMDLTEWLEEKVGAGNYKIVNKTALTFEG